jgi:hypothetical protein
LKLSYHKGDVSQWQPQHHGHGTGMYRHTKRIIG